MLYFLFIVSQLIDIKAHFVDRCSC